MATSHTFDHMGISAAHRASDWQPRVDPRSSRHHTDSRPSRLDRVKTKAKQFGSRLAKPFRSGKKPGLTKADISGPQPFANATAYGALTGERVPAGARPATGVSATSIPTAYYLPSNDRPRESALFVVNGAPTPPASVSSGSLPMKRDFTAGQSTLAQVSLPPATPQSPSVRPASEYSQRPSTSAGSGESADIGKPRPSSQPPVLRPIAPIDPHISRFDNPKESWYPGKYLKPTAELEKTTAAADTADATDAAHDEVAGTQDSATPSTPGTAHEDEGIAVRDFVSRPAYHSLYLPAGGKDALYFPYNSGIGGLFTGPTDSAYASSEALAGARFSGSSSPSTTPSTAPSSPGIPFSANDGARHSAFFDKIENHGTFTAGIPDRPTNPEPPMRPDSQEFLENVYAHAPPPPAAPAAPKRDTLKVPVPPRKPVPRPTPQAAPSSAAAPDINKSLPPFPAPHSPRRFTPHPGTYTSALPPRTDSLRPPRESIIVDPRDHSKAPRPHTMNADGPYTLHDARASRQDFRPEPAYQRSATANVKERESASRRQREEKQAARAEKKAAKARAAADDRTLRKLCGL